MAASVATRSLLPSPLPLLPLVLFLVLLAPNFGLDSLLLLPTGIGLLPPLLLLPAGIGLLPPLLLLPACVGLPPLLLLPLLLLLVAGRVAKAAAKFSTAETGAA